MFGLRGCLLCLVMVVGLPVEGEELYWPGAEGGEWEVVGAKAAGMDEEALEEVMDLAEKGLTRGLLVLRGGRIALERYWANGRVVNEVEASDVFEVHFGMLGVLIQMAVERGDFEGLDQSMSDFVKSWQGTVKEDIRLRDMMTMTSGLSPFRHRGYDIDGDQFKVNATMRRTGRPGVRHEKNLPGTQLLYGVINAATGQDIESNAKRWLFDPLEMGAVGWCKDAWHDGNRAIVNFYRPRMTARQMGRFGLFMLRDGVWKGKRLVSRDYLQEAKTEVEVPGGEATHYGMFCELDAGWGYDVIPDDAVMYRGTNSMVIVVIESMDLVVVRVGGGWQNRVSFEDILSKICIATPNPGVKVKVEGEGQ